MYLVIQYFSPFLLGLGQAPQLFCKYFKTAQYIWSSSELFFQLTNFCIIIQSFL